MEEAKAAAYYDELTRKGEGAARFKQGLGFSSSTTTTTTTKDDVVPARGSALSSSSSFLSSFVKASSSPTKASSDYQKQAQLEAIQNKLKKKSTPSDNHHHSSSSSSGRRRIRSRSRSPSRDARGSRHRRRSSSRDRDRDRDRDYRGEYRERHRERRRRRRRSSSRSLSPRDRSSAKGSRGDERMERNGGGSGGGGIDYARLIEGYQKMTPAEKVKAKMKIQLSETAEKDATKGMGSGWERFDFDKDAPLDDEEIEAAEDDSKLVKHIGQSFRFSAVEARREEEIKVAHDEAMFGASSIPPSVNTTSEREENNNIEGDESAPVISLISDTVLVKQQGSWRDRARKA